MRKLFHLLFFISTIISLKVSPIIPSIYNYSINKNIMSDQIASFQTKSIKEQADHISFALITACQF